MGNAQCYKDTSVRASDHLLPECYYYCFSHKSTAKTNNHLDIEQPERIDYITEEQKKESRISDNPNNVTRFYSNDILPALPRSDDKLSKSITQIKPTRHLTSNRSVTLITISQRSSSSR